MPFETRSSSSEDEWWLLKALTWASLPYSDQFTYQVLIDGFRYFTTFYIQTHNLFYHMFVIVLDCLLVSKLLNCKINGPNLKKTGPWFQEGFIRTPLSPTYKPLCALCKYWSGQFYNKVCIGTSRPPFLPCLTTAKHPLTLEVCTKNN